MGSSQNQRCRGRAHYEAGSPEEADKTILALALEHQLVSRLTSLVAVDKTPSRPEGEPLKLTELPLNLPAGLGFCQGIWRASAAAGASDGKARRRGRCPNAGRGNETSAAAVAPLPNAVRLPKTATDAELKMIAGSILLGLGLILLGFNRRQTFAR